jgi:hypothetical protein
MKRRRESLSLPAFAFQYSGRVPVIPRPTVCCHIRSIHSRTKHNHSARKIHQHLASDHQRLDDLLERAMSGQTIDTAAYHQFRPGLLKHIGMEEKILLPAAQLTAKEARAGKQHHIGRIVTVQIAL